MKFIITSEHASHELPEDYQDHFKGKQTLLKSAEGYDIGIKPIAEYMAKMLQADCFIGEYSRLLVDLNRTIGKRGLFSSMTQALSQDSKDDILEQYYHPYRDNVKDAVENAVNSNQLVIHLSIHSFPAVINNRERENMIGLLYDPQQYPEFKLCKRIKKVIRRTNKRVKIRMNYPYQGTSDALTTYLRTQYAEDEYIGIEVELNQKYQKQFLNFASLLIYALKHSVHKVDKHSEVNIGYKNITWL